MAKSRTPAPSVVPFAKSPTGITGLDQITQGGLPKGRPTLVCGSSGSGKTLLGMEFLAKGASDYGEPGVCFSFEESSHDLIKNVASLGFDVPAMIDQKKLLIDQIRIEPSETEESGKYDLEGLFIRLGYVIDSISAKRVVLDSIETLLTAFDNMGILRAELHRLFQWLKDKGVTAIVTGERGEGVLTRHGLEEYVSDCVILLDQRVDEQIATRRLRIVKYRGSAHGTNEYPFLLDAQGFTLLPHTAISQQYIVSDEFISSGVKKLDVLLNSKGYYRGGTVLISGTSGSGKSSLAAHFIEAACQRGERSLYFAFEESPSQVTRNMRSIGIDLQRWQDQGVLHIEAVRPTSIGLEALLVSIQRLTEQFKAQVVVFDPISGIKPAGAAKDAYLMLMRLVDYFKARQITCVLTSLTEGGAAAERSEVGISPLVDTWLLLRHLERDNERTRLVYILKSRGLAHSSEIHEFMLSDEGVDLVKVYMGPDGILTGSARHMQMDRDKANALNRSRDVRARKALLERKRKAMEATIVELRAQHELAAPGA
ncbi:MAG: circadian clock protein KaiC [Haliea sp.]|nr:circadian clock protein KaiC [Haliea sp.]